MSISIEQIASNRINEISDILIEKAKYLKATGIKMWSVNKLTPAALLRQYHNPKLFLIHNKKAIIGCFILTENDSEEWLTILPNNKSFYLHRLTVKTKFGGKGYSHKIIEWVKAYTQMQGKYSIRINFDKNRSYLKKLYSTHGFTEVSTHKVRPNLTLTLSEYKIE